MPKNYSIENTLEDGERVVRAWKENPTLTLGELTLPSLEKMVGDLRTLRSQIEDTRAQLTRMTNEANEKAAAIANAATRVRSGFRAVYGPDSTQYELAGGTRLSERKRSSSRKTASTTTDKPTT
jgi:hypothetical protein